MRGETWDGAVTRGRVRRHAQLHNGLGDVGRVRVPVAGWRRRPGSGAGREGRGEVVPTHGVIQSAPLTSVS